MRVPISWLKDYVDIPEDLMVEELAEKMTIAGLEIGNIDYIGLPQNHPAGIVVPPSDHLVWDRDKIVMGHIHEVKQHPDADRLVLAMVDHGTGEIEQIVTGAPNLFQYVESGELDPPIPCPIAREGAVVYDGHSDVPGKRMKLKEKKIRGIPNRHMVCSELELGISEEHEGVLLLDSDEFGHVAPGTPFAEVLGDVVLDVDLTPNLARLFNIVGIAREVAALLNLSLREPDYSLPNADAGDAAQLASIDIRRPDLNPRFTAAILQNVEIKPSPQWMQRRLRLIGQRPINNIVDVTNYVMFEVGQPTHAFDYDILAKRAEGKAPLLITRLPEKGEQLTTLDGAEYALQEHNQVIADAKGPVSMSGVMGGLESEVQGAGDGSKGSDTVLLEAAAWNYINIRQTVSSTKMHSEAAARFSRGVHPEMAIRGLGRAAKLMVEVSGATLVPGIIDEYPRLAEAVIVELPTAEVARILGFDIPQTEIVDILRRLHFDVSEKSDVLTVTVPDHRLDIGTGVVGQADLIEEIARIYGYNRIPDTQISDALPPQRSNPSLEREENTRDILVQAGLREVINYRLTTPEREALLVPPDMQSSWGGNGYVELANPISADKAVMRHTLLAGLLDVSERNMHFQERQALFEIGNVYLPDQNGGLPLEPTHLAILLTGRRHARDWQSAGDAGEYLDFYDLKGVLLALIDGLRIEPEGVQIVPGEHSTFHPGRVAKLIVHGDDIGYFGDVHPLVREAFELEIPLDIAVVAAELDLDRLLAYARPAHSVRAIPTQPAVYQDISLVIDRGIAAVEVEQAIWDAGGSLLVDVALFDIYTGEQIPDGKKSLAYSLTYQHPEETLTDKKVAKVHGKIVKTVEHKLGATLRQ